MANPRENGITDPKHLASNAYGNNSLIEKRRALYNFTKPRFIIENEIINLLDLKNGRRILDVGCGSGKLLTAVSTHFPEIALTGVDISSEMFSSTKQKLQKKNSLASFVVADIQCLPFASKSFDRISAVHMLYHVPNINQALSEIARVLSPEGLVIITANSINSKPTLKKLKTLAAQVMKRKEIPEPTLRFNIENGVDMVNQHFNEVKLQIYKSKLTLTDPQPYVDYFDSTRDFWSPPPLGQEWQESLEVVRDFIQQQINEQGFFEEENIFGIITASKPKNYAKRN